MFKINKRGSKMTFSGLNHSSSHNLLRVFAQSTGMKEPADLINVMHNKTIFVTKRGAMALINVSSVRFKILKIRRANFKK